MISVASQEVAMLVCGSTWWWDERRKRTQRRGHRGQLCCGAAQIRQPAAARRDPETEGERWDERDKRSGREEPGPSRPRREGEDVGGRLNVPTRVRVRPGTKQLPGLTYIWWHMPNIR